MKQIKNVLFVALFIITATMFAQKTITGVVIDELGQPLPDASVVEQGTTNGVATDFDGIFTLKTKKNTGNIVISFVGYKVKIIPIKTKLGTITLQPDANALEEVVIVGKGVVDLVKERETPVAVSTIKAAEIQEKTGNMEFPEVMKATPSVYTSKNGGGFGDSKISLRGFDNTNIAVIINGQPINDMEGGTVYWSNWSGLTDVASAIQIQRGLGASKLAVPSVGGTINVVTKSAEKKEGGSVNYLVGNDNYFKTTIAYNTGLGEDGWSASALFGRWQGDGYIDGTKGEGYSYFVALGHKLNENHSFNLSFVGASQWHHKRQTSLTIEDQLKFGKKYNADWGYLNGKEYSFARNFYNKPIASLNWDWKINEKLSLSTVLYASWGRGGGTGTRGKNYGINPYKKSVTAALFDHRKGNTLKYRDQATGLILFDDIVDNNRKQSYIGDNKAFKGMHVGSNGYKEDGVNKNIAIRRANMNSHDWYGAISNLKYELNDWTFGIGVDLRTYKGYHYSVVNDLLGLDAYYSTSDKNLNTGKFVTETIEASPFKDTGIETDSSKIFFYNVGNVGWLGTNGIIEYNNEDNLSGVLQFGVSDKSYQKTDYFVVKDKFSPTKHILGGYVKGGLNFNINENNNIFFNSGLIKRQPNARTVFVGYSNKLREDKDINNETIISYELGYGFKSEFFNANLNLYRSSWKDRFITKNFDYGDATEKKTGKAFFPNIEQLHQGVELEFRVKPIQKLTINGSVSYGDWKYADNAVSTLYDEDQKPIMKNGKEETRTLYLKDVKVGNSAQLTGSLSAKYKVTDNFKVDLGWSYSGNIYGDFDVVKDKIFLKPNNVGALKLPDYNLFDAGISYRYNFTEKYALSFRVNVNNLLDTEYISRTSTNKHANKNSKLHNGVDIQNEAWFGFGRTWNASVKFNF